jgi:uncharacterized protein
MKTPATVESTVQAVVATLVSAMPNVEAVYLFGSAVVGGLRPDSDLDFAVLAPAAVEPGMLFSLSTRLAGIAHREVDLVDLRTAPLTLQAQIVGRGRRVAQIRAEVDTAFFENQVLSRYLAFVEERRPLVAEVRNRGAIHAA